MSHQQIKTLRIEANGDATHMVFADAGNDRVGINTSFTLYRVTRDVTGAVKATGASRL
jgi:hypothetical protein